MEIVSGLTLTALVVATVLGEAYPHTYGAYRDVAACIRNRAEHSGQSAEVVCLAPKQFSAMNTAGNRRKLLRMRSTHPRLWSLASDAIADEFEHPTTDLRGVRHYVTTDLHDSKHGWWSEMREVLRRNGHVFLA